MAVRPSMEKYIADVFEEILCGKRLEDITASEIAKECGISRTTFYKYFKDKYDVVQWIYEKEVKRIREENKDLDSWKGLVLALMYLAAGKRRMFLTSYRNGEQNSLFDTAFQCGYDYCRDLILEETGWKELPPDIAFSVRMNTYAAVQMQKEWIMNGMKESPEQIATYICNNMPVPLQRFFKVDIHLQ